MKTLSCEEFRQFIDPYIDAEFDNSERALFDAHLSTCAGCRRHFEHRTWFQWINASLPQLHRYREVPPGWRLGRGGISGTRKWRHT